MKQQSVYYDKTIFSENLNRYMTLRGDKQTDIARILGVSKSTISAYCNGTQMPRMDKIEILSLHFGIKKSDLLEAPTDLATPKSRNSVSDADVRIALFGGDGEVTDEMWEEAVFAAELIKERHRRKKETGK